MMNPAFQIVLGLCFMAGGSFVVVQGLRARKARAEAGASPLPTFFMVAFYIHAAIVAVGLALVVRGLYAMSGA
jgi:hypothetical protein